MCQKKFHFSIALCAAFLLEAAFGCVPTDAVAAGIEHEKEPIRSTQSDAVPVTEELLGREGDVGPPSPTMKTVDVSEFLVKKPYEKAEQEIETAPGEESRPWWKSWFFWLDEQKKSGEQETP